MREVEMPKKDPVTGCTVQTQDEFWADEAEREGKGRSGSDLKEEFLEEVEADRRSYEERLRDPEYLIELLRAVVKRNNGHDPDYPPLPMPEKILEVIEVFAGQGHRHSETFVRARALREDGVEDVIEWSESHSSGSYYEPPDSDESVMWENFDDDGSPVSWSHLYTISHRGTSDQEAAQRRKKSEYLHRVLRRGGIRARICSREPDAELQYNARQQDEMYKALGRHLVHLAPNDPFWDRLR